MQEPAPSVLYYWKLVDWKWGMQMLGLLVHESSNSSPDQTSLQSMIPITCLTDACFSDDMGSLRIPFPCWLLLAVANGMDCICTHVDVACWLAGMEIRDM